MTTSIVVNLHEMTSSTYLSSRRLW